MRHQRALALLAALAVPTAASAFESIGAIWPDGRAKIAAGDVGYWWQLNVRRACDEWEDATPFNFMVTLDDHPACSEDLHDLRGGVEFSETLCGGELFSPDVLAVMQAIVNEEGEFVEAGITFNSYWTWKVYDGPVREVTYDEETQRYEGEMDFYRVALHELGHYLGLGHSNGEASIMGSTISEISSLQPDDVAGVEELYGDGSGAPPTAPVRRSPAVRCRVQQLRAAARLCKRDLRCEATHVASPARDPGGTARDACVAQARADFADEWDAAIAAAAARGASCNEQTDGATVEPSITAATLQAGLGVGAASATDPADRAVRSKLLKRLGELCQRDFRAWRDEAVEPDAEQLASRLEDAEAAFTLDAQSAIDGAAARGAAYDGAVPAALVLPIETLANALGAATGP